MLYVVTLRPAHPAAWHARRLAGLLKVLGRRFGLRCVDVVEREPTA